MCRTVSHTPNCICLAGFVGDPFISCLPEGSGIIKKIQTFSHPPILAKPVLLEEPTTPCIPSPCGTNAICKEQNGAGSCTCLPDYVGNPYEGCRPECILNSDCAANLACIQSKCRDPCPGTCGLNAECRVVNHLAACTCSQGYIGNPFSFCNPAPTESKKSVIPFITFF